MFKFIKITMSPEAIFERGVQYFYGLDGVQKNLKLALENFKSCADRNPMAKAFLDATNNDDPTACFKCGEHFKKVALQNLILQAEAVNFYSRAAKKNHADAQYELGQCYELGFFVQKNRDTAIDFYLKADQQNHAKAQLALAKYYYDQKENAEAFYFCEKSADNNNPDAQYQIALHYFNSVKDDEQAFNYFEKAARFPGPPEAKFMLGYCYLHGIGVPKDKGKANWHFKAARAPGTSTK